MRLWVASLLLGLGSLPGVVGGAWAQGAQAPAGPGDGASAAARVRAHEEKARQYLEQKEPVLAIPEFAAIVAAEPKNLDAQANLGVLLYFQGRFAEAEPHLRAALELRSDLANIQALLGMCDHALGRDAEARDELEAALPKLKEAKVRVQAGLQLVEIYTAEHELAKASPVLESLREIAPTDPRVLYAAYRTYTDLAREALVDLSLAAPDSGQVHQAMAHEQQRERDAKGAIVNYRAAIAIDPHLPGIHYELAEVLHAASDPAIKAEAKGEYELALKENPTDARSLTRLADIASDAGDDAKAEALYRRALKIQPGEADASIGLARVLTDESKFGEALPLLEGVIAADPTNMLAHFRLAAVYRRMGKPELAKREIQTYEHYKALQDKLQKVYDQLKQNGPQGADAAK